MAALFSTDPPAAGPEALLDAALDDGSGAVKLDRFQVLSPYRTGFAGAGGLNLFFQTEYRSSREFAGGTADSLFKLDDKVMRTQNEYDLTSSSCPTARWG